MPETVSLLVDGRPVDVPIGCMVSAAVFESGAKGFRRSITGELRAPLCGMGTCFECRVTIDGEGHVRSCQTPCRAGMSVRTDEQPEPITDTLPIASPNLRSLARECDVLIIGAGPAGLAAAYRSVESGATVIMLDDNERAGGQIWRAEQNFSRPLAAAEWLQRLEQTPAQFVHGARVFDISAKRVSAETESGVIEIAFQSLIVASGARERFLPFPGWSMANVCGAGGLQALVKSGLAIQGKRVVVAGTGPLLLAVADFLRKRGAVIPLIAEQASMSRLARFAFGLISTPGKLAEALAMRRRLHSVRLMTSCWPICVEGHEKLERVILRQGQRTLSVDCDFLACGFHLVPNVEVAALAGCVLKNGAVEVDEFQETSVSGIFCAGEATGIGGLELSLLEGEIAGYAATGRMQLTRKHFYKRDRLRGFAERLNRTFSLRDELKLLPHEDTLVCRCEDVSWGSINKHDSFRAAKLHTRCGMGPCQGRVCGSALSFLRGWAVDSTRPPIFPVRTASLAQSKTREG